MSAGAQVSRDATIPVTVLIGVLIVVGTTVTAALLKNALFVFAERKAVDTAEENDTMFMGCLSPVHTFAIAYYVFYLQTCITNLFVTSLFVNPNCFVVKTVHEFGQLSTKCAQYGFFIMRMHYVFRGSSLAVPVETVKKLCGLVVYYFVSSVALITADNFLRNPSSFYTKTTDNNNQAPLTTCAFLPDQPTIVVGLFAMNWLACDTTIMISVVRGFVSRLLQMSSMVTKNKMMMKTVNLAHKALSMLVFSIWSTVILVFISLILPGNLLPNIFGLVDGLMNGLAIFANFQFGHFVFEYLCSPCNPCVGTCLAVCCARKYPQLKEVILSAMEEERPVIKNIASVTASKKEVTMVETTTTSSTV